MPAGAGHFRYYLLRIGGNKEYEVKPKLAVAIGPAAGICCYEVGAEVIDGFRERFAYAEELFVATRALIC